MMAVETTMADSSETVTVSVTAVHNHSNSSSEQASPDSSSSHRHSSVIRSIKEETSEDSTLSTVPPRIEVIVGPNRGHNQQQHFQPGKEARFSLVLITLCFWCASLFKVTVMSSTGLNGRNQRSSSICLSNSQQTFDAMKASIGNRESSSGSDSPEVIRSRDIPPIGYKPIKARQKAGRSKSERIQGANKPRITKRRDIQMDPLNRANSGSLAGGLSGKDECDFMRKVPSVGTALMNDDTPDGSPRLSGRSMRPPFSSRPPMSGSNVPSISTPELSPSLIRRATVNSAGRSTGTSPRPAAPTTRSSPVSRAKEQSLNKRAASVRVHGASSSLLSNTTNNASIRRSTYLDVPDSPGEDDGSNGANLDEDSYRLRSFDLTRKGVVNRGDSFRRRRSRSNSLAPSNQQDSSTSEAGPAVKNRPNGTSTGKDDSSNLSSADSARKAANFQLGSPQQHASVKAYKVAIIGAHGVGKSALVGQFMTSDCINAYDRVRSEDTDSESVFVMLNGEESELAFSYFTNVKMEMNRNELPDAYVIMYSVIDKTSFQRAEDELARLQNLDPYLRARALIIVGNKIDLVRSRAVSTQDGKCLAKWSAAKFTEVSVVINHNVDELLVGILTQIRLKEELRLELGEAGLGALSADAAQSGSSTGSWVRNKGLVRASMKAKQMFSWLFGAKDDDQFANCENFQVL